MIVRSILGWFCAAFYKWDPRSEHLLSADEGVSSVLEGELCSPATSVKNSSVVQITILMYTRKGGWPVKYVKALKHSLTSDCFFLWEMAGAKEKGRGCIWDGGRGVHVTPSPQIISLVNDKVMTPTPPQGCVQPRQNNAKRFFKRKRWCVEHPVLMTQVLQLWQLRRPLFVFFLKNLLSLMKSV